jgi:hypothetical protein
MTDDSSTPEPTPSSGGRWRAARLGAALAFLVGTVVACGTDSGDDDPTATDSGASTASTSSASSASASTSESSSASASPSDNGDPVPSPIIDKAAKDAIADDFPAMVPAGVPAGWTVQKATYSEKRGGIWRIDLADPNGALVQVVQSKKTIEGIVHEYLGKQAQESGQVDLSGTGKWAVWTSGTGTGLAKQISDTAALVWGPDQDTAVTLAEELLTAEDAVATED